MSLNGLVLDCVPFTSTNSEIPIFNSDVILAQLLSFGFDEWICQRAITRTKTVEEATEWILNTLDENSGNRTTSINSPVLRLSESSERVSAPMMVDTEQSSSAASSSTSKPMESKAKAAKATEEMKRLKLLEREARKKTLLAIKEDRENLKLRKISHKVESSSSASSYAISTPLKTEQSDSTLIQIRLSTGQAIRQKFNNTALVSDLFNWVVSKNEPSKKFQLLLPFPRKVFGDDEMGSTLADAGLVPNASLNVVKLDVPSITAQSPISRVTSSITGDDSSDDDGDNSIRQSLPNVPNPLSGPQGPPLNLPQHLPPPIPLQQGIPPNLPLQFPPPITTQPGIPTNVPPPIPFQPGIPPNVHPPMPVQPGNPFNAPPLAPRRFPPNMGPPHRMLARPSPFSGTVFRLTNNQPVLQQQDSDDDSDDEEKRQRIAEAVQARSRCAYCVAGNSIIHLELNGLISNSTIS
ncbi:12344_t:CDS:2 [Dentiscutata heterogama]|uniref:12344_t:CDS:1 n=1 Tax=Dentiscutata heterogama TaxID=1316150 RepID=A0ACA9KMG1_9GLOM|nr:12344_t:CDS:2 [Dentiscutata heterogama]